MTLQQQTIRWGPEFTPATIRNLIFLTAGISLISALSEPLLNILFNLPGPAYLFSLSWQGLQRGYLWQFVTYLFFQDTEGHGLSLSFLIGLTFNIYLLWVMGTDLMEKVGKWPFLRFYFAAGIAAGLAAIGVMSLTGQYAILSGPTPSIIAVLTAWTLFNPEAELYIFFLFSIKAKWLWSILAGAFIISSLSHMDWVSLGYYGTAILAGYVAAVAAWDQRGPFRWMRPFDALFAAIGRGISGIFSLRPGDVKKGKIIDFKTGDPLLDDNQFVDSMLEKISKQGESSLTWKERQRLQEISKAKQKK
ncbi:MAG: rhomboid family intramembrane serine protease [Parachlamydia sp.]|nr:rhomboid family intramembrane serine protease [Parachlamydia sp.]